ncbi:hypothetical protein NQ317_018300 [Molorchus minor]|uniref:Uncharacterized protein n=1 Tax=Molorchus minor TaxID=1323400 RepID=A0ABQ9J3S9_9CUCU|nr:hypothetical protein NQ317_018300 [Molorchus minor]
MSSGFVSKVGINNGVVDGLPDLRRLDISPITSVEEFCPDGGQLTGFLDDVQFSMQNSIKEEAEQSDSDTDTGNPLVSELQEDCEPDEFSFSKPQKFNKKPERASNNVPLRIVKSEESSEIEIEKTVPEDYDMKQTNDEFDSTINSEISELTSDAYDAWMGTDTKWRRSPEGGEDNSVVSQTLDYSNSTAYDDSTSVTSSNVNMELLISKQSSNNGSVVSDSEETHTSSSVKKEKKKKDKEKTEKKIKKKSKDKDKHKESSKSEKKHKRRSREETSSHRDELEEFLNGPASSPIDVAYEAI